MTQSELATAMGTTQSVISRVETGGRMPTVAFLERYAWAAGRMLSMDIGPPARQRGVRWVTPRPGLEDRTVAGNNPIDAETAAAGRVERARQRLERGEISPGEYAMERLLAELDLAEQRTAPI